MFRMSWNSECEIQGTLKLKRDPFYYGLGIYEDVDGRNWDIHGVIGIGNKPYVQARLTSDSESYYGTAPWDTSAGHHTWKPYYVEIIK